MSSESPKKCIDKEVRKHVVWMDKTTAFARKPYRNIWVK
jgi:hypothetical protein